MVICAYCPLRAVRPAFEFCSFVACPVERPLSLSVQSLGFLPSTSSHVCFYNGKRGVRDAKKVDNFVGRPAMNFD